MNNKLIGNRINTVLANQNKKQKELAKELGVKDNIVSYWCSGTRMPNTEQIVKIAKLLGVSADYLLGLADCQNSDQSIEGIHKKTALSERAIIQLTDRPKQLNLIGEIHEPDIDVLNCLIESNIFWVVIRNVRLMVEASDSVTNELFNMNKDSLVLKGYAIKDYFRNNAVNYFAILIDEIRRTRGYD